MNVHSETGSSSDTRTKILRAALAVFSERGLYDAPMSSIAQSAGIAAGTIYLHFPGKAQLIDALYSHAKEEMGKALAGSDSPEAGYEERFLGFWDSLFAHFLQNPSEFVFLEHFAHSPLIQSKTREENVRHYKPVRDFLASGVESGVLAPADPDWLTGLLYGTVTASVRFVIDSGAASEEVRAAGRQAAWKAAAAAA